MHYSSALALSSGDARCEMHIHGRHMQCVAFASCNVGVLGSYPSSRNTGTD